MTEKSGRRAEALSAITNAVAIQPSLELRDEAIAAFTLLDAEQTGQMLRPTDLSVAEFDGALTRYAFAVVIDGIPYGSANSLHLDKTNQLPPFHCAKFESERAD